MTTPEQLADPAGRTVPRYLVDAVTEVDCLHDPFVLRQVVQRLGAASRTNMDRTSGVSSRGLVVQLMGELCAHEAGLAPLVEALELRDGNSAAVRRLKVAVAVWQVELFDSEQWEELFELLEGVEVPDLHRRYSAFLQQLGRLVAPNHCVEPWAVFLHAATLNSRPGESLPCFQVLRNVLAMGAESKTQHVIIEWARDNELVPYGGSGGGVLTFTEPSDASWGNPLIADAQHGLRADAEHGLRADAQHGLRADAEHGLRADAQHGLRADAEHDPRSGAEHDPRARAQHDVWRPDDYLIIRLLPLLSPDQDGDTLLSHWWRVHPGEQLRGADRRIGIQQAEHEVRALVCEAESDWAYYLRSDLALEFVLPRGLLNLGVQHWGKASFEGTEGLLGEEHQVVLRSLERINRRDLHGRWGKRWRAFAEGEAGRVHWFPEDGRPHLLSEPPPAVVVLSAPPGGGRSARGERRELDELAEALRVGVPVILWDRRGERDPSFRAALRSLLVEHDPRELPGIVKALRTSAATPDAEEYFSVGRHVALLWDDPERMPDTYPGSGAVPPPTPGEESP